MVFSSTVEIHSHRQSFFEVFDAVYRVLDLYRRMRLQPIAQGIVHAALPPFPGRLELLDDILVEADRG